MLDCVICLEPLAGEALSSTSCGHILHEKCLKRSMRVKRECPICRQLVKGMIRIFLNLEHSASQRTPARPVRVVENISRAVERREVVDLLSDPIDDTENIAIPENRTSATVNFAHDIEEEEDAEYPNLERLQYSDIEPDLNEIDELQDALARANMDIENLRRFNRALTDAATAKEEQMDGMRDEIYLTKVELGRLRIKAEMERQLHETTKMSLNMEMQRLHITQKELDRVKAENNSLLMRKISSDIERILADLTLEQALAYGADLTNLPHEQICLRMLALIQTSKEDRSRLHEAEREAKKILVECEQWRRRARRAESEVAELREENTILNESVHVPEPPKIKSETISQIPEKLKRPIEEVYIDRNENVRPQTAPKPLSTVPKPPAKFAAGIKKSFQVPDGLGGFKKPFF